VLIRFMERKLPVVLSPGPAANVPVVRQLFFAVIVQASDAGQFARKLDSRQATYFTGLK
jgi:hypothetical protein